MARHDRSCVRSLTLGACVASTTSDGSRSASERVSVLSAAQHAVAAISAKTPSIRPSPSLASTTSSAPPTDIAMSALVTRAPIGSR